MLKFCFFIISFLTFTTLLYSQVSEDFNDGDFRENPEWYGDLADFIINNQYQLQLDAAQGGKSKIFVRYSTFDSLQWDLYFKMDFNPSNSNKLTICLALDNVDIEKSSGYILEIGENGNNDNIKLYRLNQGEKIFLAEGEAERFAVQPAEAFIRVRKSADGIWSVYSKKDEGYYVNEFEVFSNIPIPDSAYFMLQCRYTSTRKNKFFFDDIFIDKLELDRVAPKILSTEVISKNSVKLIFDEPLNKESAGNIANYHLENNNIIPDSALVNDSLPNTVRLFFTDEFQSGIYYRLIITGIEDLAGNSIATGVVTTFFLIDIPDENDIAINEILFNPLSGGNDFLEIINVSDRILNLKGLTISNNYKDGKDKVIKGDVILHPGHYLCISKDTDRLKNDYFVPDTANLYKNDLPSFDDDKGNVTLSFYNEEMHNIIIIDSFDYDEDLHSGFLNNVEGVSLERKNPFSLTNDHFNWSSSATINGGATPGYKNSVFYTPAYDIKDDFKFKKDIFSPDFDGIDDNLIMEYSFDKENILANIYIFDSKGRMVSKLVNNESLSKQGIIIWDGFVNGKKMPVGIYILLIDLIDIDGYSKKFKKAFILAQNLN